MLKFGVAASIQLRGGNVSCRYREYGYNNVFATSNHKKIKEDTGVKIEELKVFEFDCGEQEWVIAKNIEEAKQYYSEFIGAEDLDGCDITELENWHEEIIREEVDEKQPDGSYWKDITMLEMAKARYINGYDEPEILATTCC